MTKDDIFLGGKPAGLCDVFQIKEQTFPPCRLSCTKPSTATRSGPSRAVLSQPLTAGGYFYFYFIYLRFTALFNLKHTLLCGGATKLNFL